MSTILAVNRGRSHHFSKQGQLSIRLVPGFGIEGDAHAGATVKHRSRLERTPEAPNLRQIHLIHAELFDELRAAGFEIAAGQLGENITTVGVPLLDLPTGTRLKLGRDAVVELTGLRNPCIQIDRFRKGLLKAVVGRDENGGLIRKTGVMSVVVTGGDVYPNDPIAIALPSAPHLALEPV